MQTSLVPGPLFQQTGLNRCSTPVGPRATPQEIQELFKRKDFHEDIEWPPDSPSAQVYDVSNSSAKLVILNNQHKESRRLRGYDNHPRPPSGNPDRHVAPNYPVKNHERHTACTDSSTPVYKPGTDLKDMWINSTARPAITPERKRHEGCQLPTHPYYTSLEHAKPKKPGGVKAVMRKPPINVQSNPNLIHPGMSEGHKRCMYFIAQAYDMSNMKRLKQLAYRDLLMRQQYLGFHKESQYIKYMKYLEGPRKKQFGDKESLFKSGQRPSSNRPESAPPMPLTSDRTTPRDTSPKSTPRAVKLGPLPPRRRPKSSIPRASSAPGKQSREKPFLQKITEDDLHSSPISVRKNAFEEAASTEGSPRQDDREAMDSADEMAPSESSRSSRSSVSSKSSRSSKSSTVKAKSNSSAKSSKSGADEESKPLPNQTCDSQDKVDTKEGESDGEEREGKLSVRTTSTTTSMTSFETKTETEDYVPESSSRYESDTKTVTESGWSRGRQDTTKDDYRRLQEVEEEEVPTKEEQPEQGTGVDFIKSAKIDQDETLVKEIEKETFEGVDDKPNVEKQGLKEDKSGDRTEATADVPKQSDEETPKFETEQREEDQKASKRSDTESTDTESLSTGTESASSNNETKPTETEHVKAEDEEKPTEPAETENTNLQELKQKSLTVYFREDLTPAKDLGEPAETQKQDSEHIVDDAEEEAKDEEEKQQQELYDVEEEKRAPPSVSGAASSSLSKSDDDDDVMASETQAVSTTTYATEHAQTTRREDEADPRLDYPESDTQPIETITQEDGEVVAFIESSAIDKDDTLVKEVEQEVFEASTEAQVRGGAEHETQAESKQTTGDEMPITQTQAVNETQPRATEELDVPTTEDHLHKGSVNENETPVSQTQPESETEPAVNDKPLREVESDSESSSSSRSNASDSGSQTTQEDAPKLVDTTDMEHDKEEITPEEKHSEESGGSPTLVINQPPPPSSLPALPQSVSAPSKPTKLKTRPTVEQITVETPPHPPSVPKLLISAEAPQKPVKRLKTRLTGSEEAIQAVPPPPAAPPQLVQSSTTPQSLKKKLKTKIQPVQPPPPPPTSVPQLSKSVESPQYFGKKLKIKQLKISADSSPSPQVDQDEPYESASEKQQSLFDSEAPPVPPPPAEGPPLSRSVETPEKFTKKLKAKSSELMFESQTPPPPPTSLPALSKSAESPQILTKKLKTREPNLEDVEKTPPPPPPAAPPIAKSVETPQKMNKRLKSKDSQKETETMPPPPPPAAAPPIAKSADAPQKMNKRLKSRDLQKETETMPPPPPPTVTPPIAKSADAPQKMSKILKSMDSQKVLEVTLPPPSPPSAPTVVGSAEAPQKLHKKLKTRESQVNMEAAVTPPPPSSLPAIAKSVQFPQKLNKKLKTRESQIKVDNTLPGLSSSPQPSADVNDHHFSRSVPQIAIQAPVELEVEMEPLESEPHQNKQTVGSAHSSVTDEPRDQSVASSSVSLRSVSDQPINQRRSSRSSLSKKSNISLKDVTSRPPSRSSVNRPSVASIQTDINRPLSASSLNKRHETDITNVTEGPLVTTDSPNPPSRGSFDQRSIATTDYNTLRPASRASIRSISSVSSLEKLSESATPAPIFIAHARPDDSVSLIEELKEELGLNYDRVFPDENEYYSEDERLTEVEAAELTHGDANEQAAFDEDNDVLETASVSSSSGWEDDDELKKSREGKDRPRTRLGNRPMPTPEADQSTSKANGETQDQHEAALESEEAKDEGNQATDTRSQATKQEEFYEQAQRMRFKRTDVTLVSAQTSGEQGSGHTEDKKESEAMKSVEEVEIVHDVTQIEENPDIEIDPAEVPQYPRLC